jgi:putative transposase
MRQSWLWRVKTVLLLSSTKNNNRKKIRMTHQNESSQNNTAVQHILDNGLDGIGEAIRLVIDQAMKIERSHALQAQPHERTEKRQGYANGFKGKTVSTRMGDIRFSVPQVRGEVDFYPSALEKGLRSERALKLAIAEMYVQGVSTRKVTAVLEQLCGLEISSTQVSQATAEMDLELAKWRTRPLGQFKYLIVDARYEKVRIDGTVRSCAVLIALGVDAKGQRVVLGVSAKLSEAEIHWRDFLGSLQERGLHGLEFIVSDHHAGLRAALAARLPGVPWQRCQFHLQQNAMAHVPKVHMREEVAADIRTIFHASDLAEAQRRLQSVAQKYRESAPQLAEWIEANAPEALTVFNLPEAHRKKLRTTNSLERLNKEIKRRTRVATLFPNEKSLERLVTALLSEISDEWETGKTYLTMKN